MTNVVTPTKDNLTFKVKNTNDKNTFDETKLIQKEFTDTGRVID